MSDNLSDVESFGAKLGAETAHLEEEIAEQIAAMDASGGEPPEKLEEVFSAAKQQEGEGKGEAAKTRIKSSYRRPSPQPRMHRLSTRWLRHKTQPLSQPTQRTQRRS